LISLPRALYIHIPWCIRKCPYCDFNSHEQANPDFARYGRALVHDLNADLERYGSIPFVSLFFGGGTPSLFPPQHLEPLFQRLRDLDLVSDHTEITLEANPGTLDRGHLSGYRDLGINRLSIGVQSFNEEVLKALGRIHDKDQAVAMIEHAKAIGFDRLNVDLMHGTPGQTPLIAQEDLNIIRDLEVSHLSWYQLTIEPNTAFYSKPPTLPEEDALEVTEEMGSEIINAMGLKHYEVSAFAKSGEEARHNLNYWEFGDYLGIGAGAHGKITTERGVVRTQRTRQPSNYLSRTDFHATEHPLSDGHLGAECLMNGLRLKSGISYACFQERTGLDPVEFRAAHLIEADRLQLLNPGRFQASELGWRHLNRILEMLI
jgi:putative oxygen-independent coproporphyrinogen III oxidase